MAAPSRVCWRCALQRPSLQASHFPSPAASFSTSTSLKAAAASKGGRPTGPPQRGRKALVLNKKKDKNAPKAKRPVEGERRAIKQRIVLSNTNAFEVENSDWTVENCCGEGSQALTGSVVTLQDDVVSQLRSLDSFKTTQAWSFFKRPSTLIRQATTSISDAVDTINNGSSESYRRMITGDRGVGKSLLLLQAHTLALMNGWIVIHLPEAQDLVNGHTAYGPIPKSTQFSQPTYVAALLGRIAAANRKILDELTLVHEHPSFPVPLQDNMSLSRLCAKGAEDPDIAWDVYTTLWKELTLPVPEGKESKNAKSSSSGNTKRPPILLTLDGLAHISRFSAYVTPSMHNIHSFDLALVNHFVGCLNGVNPLGPAGGMVLAADSLSNRPSTPSLDLAIRQAEARAHVATLDANALPDPSSFSSSETSPQAPPSTSPTALRADNTLSSIPHALASLTLFDPTNPYARHDTRSLAAFQTVDVLRIDRFTKEEARAMLEYYAKSGMFRSRLTDAVVTERWSLAGGGLARELERGSVRAGLL